MKSTTAYNHQKRLISLVRAIYSETRVFKRDHLKHIEAMKRVWEDEGLRKCPGHVKSYISGYSSCLWDQFTLSETIWVLPFEGVNYLKWDNLPEEGKEEYRKGNLCGKHVHKSDMLSNW